MMFQTMMTYSSSGASQIKPPHELPLHKAGYKINSCKRQCWPSGNGALPARIIARTSNMEMRPSWSSGINHRIPLPQLNLLTSAIGFKKKEVVNKIVAKKDVAAKAMSNNVPHIKYDVFVSFRGKDIRHGFLSHLIEAFSQKKIHAFVDDNLERGDEISQSLLEAIEGSCISLVIFSKEYASSRWCLEELSKIVECNEKYGQILIPVFYNVDPTNVRNQKGSYEDALAKHEQNFNLSNNTKVQMWRRALNYSANLSGINSTNFRNDAEMLEDIINLLLKKLSNQPIINSKELIGIDERIEDIESLLHQESKDVRVLGIWGMGGIGKTTLAEEVFNKQYLKYDRCCILLKVREESERQGIISLKEKLFSTLLAEDVKINTTNGLSHSIKRRIGNMKILIVLDDVNDSNQLEQLVGSVDWFGPGSRIIITTRDRQVLHNKVDDIYEVGVLSSSEALELFTLNAFPQSHLVKKEFYDLSERVINYAKGIPLVLEVLGHLLRGKDKVAWESQLDKLKKMPNIKVHDVMKLSFDDLDRKEQKIFLDLACFFGGLKLKVDYLKVLLKDYESDNAVAIGLERLKDKALITISGDNTVSMHDIVQEMGWEILRQESSEDNGSCSRLWDPDDICEILKTEKGTREIISIRTPVSALTEKLKLRPHIFAKMSKLQFLDFHAEYPDDCLDLLPEGLHCLSSNIKYLRWIKYPLNSLPDNFSAASLVILDMSFSQVEKLWDGKQNLVNLKIVNLYGCKFLKELPDFTNATNLKELILGSCDELKSVHPSILSLNKLEKLDLSSCHSLTSLTSDSHLSSLQYLNLAYCRRLEEFSITSENMIELRLTGTKINALPSSFGRQRKLEILVLHFTDIKSLPSCIKSFTRLKYLDLMDCSMLQTLPEIPPSLKTLRAERCSSLTTVLFPSTAIEQLKENRRVILFWNCLKLDKHSLLAIEFNVKINVMKHANENLPAPELDPDENYDNYKVIYDSYRAKYVYPGSRVPKWLDYKTTNNHIIIDLSSTQLLPPVGFIFCFNIAAMDSEYSPEYELRITIREGQGKSKKVKGSFRMYMERPFHRIVSDHVCVVYDQQCSRYLNSKAKNMTRLKVTIKASKVVLKGFGLSLINTSKYENFVEQMKCFDYINKWSRAVFAIFLCISFMQLKINNLI